MAETLLRYLPILFAVDGLLVVMHALRGTDRFWNLDKEHNLPTWFAGVQLVLLALAALDCHEIERGGRKRFLPPTATWALLSIAFLYLSLDETTAIHEGVLRNQVRDLFSPDSLWISLLPWQLVFGPVLAVLAVLLLGLFATRFATTRGLLVPALAGLGCWAMSVLAEGIAKPVFMAGGAYSVEVALEEGLELFGATLLLLAFCRYAAWLRLGRVEATELREQGRRVAIAAVGVLAFIAVGVTVVVAASLRSSAWLYRHNAAQLEKRGKLAEAAVAYGAAIERNPEDWASLRGRARCNLGSSRYAEALQDLDRAVELRPADARGWQERGAALYRLGRLEEAESSYRKAVALDPRDSRGWRNLGAVLEKAGKAHDAEAAYRRALEARPGDRRAKKRLERLQGARNDAMDS